METVQQANTQKTRITDKILTPGNLLSVARVLALPFVIMTHQANDLQPNALLAALTAFIFLSDFLDGYLSRKFGMVSETGKWLDPLADKICAVVLFTYIWLIGWFPLWFFLILVLRDVFILIGSLFIRKQRGKVAMSVMTGKVAVFILSLYWITLIFFPDWDSISMMLKYASVFMILLSGAVYVVRGYKILKGADFN